MSPTVEDDQPKTGARRRPRFRILMMFFCVMGLGTLLTGEFLVRASILLRGWTVNCYAPQLDMFVPDAQNGSTLKANFELKSGVFHITTNRLGLRGPDVTSEKDVQTLRIAVLGGSSAFGYFASDGQEAARLLETSLDNQGRKVEVINGGVPGYNLYQHIHRYQNVVAPLKPDLVILYLGWNDLTYIVSEEPTSSQFQRRGLAPGWERMLGKSTLYTFLAYRLFPRPPKFAPTAGMNRTATEDGAHQFRSNLSRLLDEINSSGATAIVCSQLMAAHHHADSAVKKYLGRTDSDVEKVIELGAWLRNELQQFASEHHLQYVSATDVIPISTEYLRDPIHVTVKGEQALAELWEDAVTTEFESNPNKGKALDPEGERQ